LGEKPLGLTTTEALPPDQTTLARFWSDDAVLSCTQPGPWTVIMSEVSAAGLLAPLTGDNFAFTDQDPPPDGVPQRAVPCVRAAADVAAIIRRYGGLHFCPAITNGQAPGHKIAAFAIKRQTRA
jgi:hypothetical protein